MKLVIPEEIQVGAHSFKICWSSKILDLQEARGGMVYRKELLIRLLPNRPITQGFQTFLHEVLHAIDNVFVNSDELTENQVQLLAAGLAQVFASMGIEPDFSQIKEEKL